MHKRWKAKWIMDKKFCEVEPLNVFYKTNTKLDIPDHDENLKNHHMLIRRKFVVETEIEKAFIEISADDYYKLYINGQFVGQGPAPGYYFHYNYNTFDIAKYLHKGDNVIAIHVYYQGLINRVWNSGDYRQGMIAELFFNDNLFLQSDSSWKYIIDKKFTSKKTIGYETQFIEDIDERFANRNWHKNEFDDSHWQNTYENTCDDHKLVKQITPPLQVYEIKPYKIDVLDKGHYLIDFGHEITGQFKMKAQGERGQLIEVRCGEELDDDFKRVKYDMRCNCLYKDLWTLSGNIDILEQYDYKAFRYVEIIAPECVINPENFLAVVRHYPYDANRCKFTSSNDMLNKIWELCKNAVLYGSQEVYVDCPSREKGQYLGDFTVTGKSHIYLSGDSRLYKKALNDFALSSFICPGLMAVAPSSFMQEIADYSLQWPEQLLTYYYHTGDIKFLNDMYSITEGCIEYFNKFKRKDGLIENVYEKWNLVDWPPNMRDNYDFDLSDPVSTGCHNVINAFYCGAIESLNEIRDILHIKYTDDLPLLKKAYIDAFLNTETSLFKDSEISNHSSLHSNILPLYFNLAPKNAIKSVIDLVKVKKLSCGIYMSYYLLKGLAKVKEYDFVYSLIMSEEEHSWVNMIKEGATTCFEAWGKDQKWNTSLCHPWASAPISILIEDIIGLKPKTPGWSEISFNPNIPKALDSLSLKITVPSGVIKVDYNEGHVEFIHQKSI